MYNCEMCGNPTKPGESIIRHTVRTRRREYSVRRYKGKKRRESEEDSEFDPGAEPNDRMIFDPGGVGREIVKEAKVCNNCGLKLAIGSVTFRPFKAPFRATATPRKKRPKMPAPAPIVEEIKTLRVKSHIPVDFPSEV